MRSLSHRVESCFDVVTGGNYQCITLSCMFYCFLLMTVDAVVAALMLGTDYYIIAVISKPCKVSASGKMLK